MPNDTDPHNHPDEEAHQHTRRCWGLVPNLHRCDQSGEWGFFCPAHKRQWIIWAFTAVFTGVAGTLQIISFFNGPSESVVVLPSPLGEVARSPDPKLQRLKISYATDRPGMFSSLSALVDGREYRVIPEEEELCLDIFDEADYDGNGSVDALVTNIISCGGNATGNSFFFVSYRGDGHFEISEDFGYSWDDPIIETWKGARSVLVTGNNAGINVDAPKEDKERYVLSEGVAVLVERSERREMVAVTEIRSDIFVEGDSRRIEKLMFDLDADGKNDALAVRYWERWGSMIWTVEFANGRRFESNSGIKRLGVLRTSTNGVRDLVVDHDTIVKWTGSAYDIR